MSTRNLDKHVADLERDGYTIIPDVLSPAEIRATRQAMDETLAREEEIGRRLGTQSNNLRMVFEAHGKHPHFYGLVLRNPEPLHVSRRILGDDHIRAMTPSQLEALSHEEQVVLGFAEY